MTFFVHGYSNSLDTIKKQNCPNGLAFQINGKERCIDTTLLYYPLIWERDTTMEWDKLGWDGREFVKNVQYNSKMISNNLQILGESKWYNEDIQEDRLRFFLIGYPPNYNSIILYSFFEQSYNYIKLIKKEMSLFYHDDCFLPDSNYFKEGNTYYLPDINYVFPDSSSCFINKEENYFVNFKQEEIIIHKRKMKKLITQLDILKKCETFDEYFWDLSFVIEYTFEGKYYLLLARQPYYWFYPENDNCPRKSGLKIEKWLNRY
jgi:hypothetical protein